MTAAQYYEQAMVDEWSPTITTERIDSHRDKLQKNEDETIIIVAEIGGQIVGFGELVHKTNELGAVYVSPTAGRKGVGSSILNELEKLAHDTGVQRLWLDASLNAEKFYLRHGFVRDGMGEHTFRSGLKMPCIKMHKQLSV
jgi:putative acetyltransferase